MHCVTLGPMRSRCQDGIRGEARGDLRPWCSQSVRKNGELPCWQKLPRFHTRKAQQVVGKSLCHSQLTEEIQLS